MNETTNRSEEDLRGAVEAALRGPLGHEATHVGVAVDGGYVTLSGQVHTDLQRRAARVAALYVAGVEAVENNVVAHEGVSPAETDEQLTVAAQRAIELSPEIPYRRVGVVVDERVLTLSGNVNCAKVSYAAEQIASALPGLRAVRNQIVVHDDCAPCSGTS